MGHIPPAAQMELLAGGAGVNRMITWAHAVDTDDPWLWVEPGDLMMSTGANLPSDEQEQIDWLQQLDSARVSAILLEIPPSGLVLTEGLIQCSDARGLPLITVSQPVQFNKIAHIVVESALRSRWERTEMIQRLFSSYTRHLRRGVSQAERLQELCRILDAEVYITHTDTDAVIFHHTIESTEGNQLKWQRIELPGRGREVAYLRPGSSGLITDEEFMWHWSTLVGMELGFEAVQLDQMRAQGEPLLRNLIGGKLDAVTLRPLLEQRGLGENVQLIAVEIGDTQMNKKTEYLDRVHLIPGLRNEPHLVCTLDEVLYIALQHPVSGSMLEQIGAGATVVAGLSRPVSAANPYPKAAEQALNALHHARSKAVGSAHFDEFVSHQFGVFDQESIQQRIDKTLGPLIKYDKQNGTELLDTLRTYLEADRSGTNTAKILMVHRQTLVYRLKMVHRLTGINPNSTVGIVTFYDALTSLTHLQPRESSTMRILS
jgi:purine catabolism regulator